MNDQAIFPGFDEYIRKRRIPQPAGQAKWKKQPKRNFSPLTTMFSLNPDYFTIYKDTTEIRAYRRSNGDIRDSANHVKRILNTGTLSRGGRSRMKRACNYLYMIAHEKPIWHEEKKYWFDSKMSVITLTLSDKQKHPDGFIKQHLFKNFIDTMRQQYPALSYVWRAETQGNGRLHFHILTDHFIPTWYVNKVWNRIQYRHEYLNNYIAKSIRLAREAEKKGDNTKNISRNAPSVEIRKVRSEKDLGRYMRKYMTKGFALENVDIIKEKIRMKAVEILECETPSKAHELQVHYESLHKQLKEAQKRKVDGKLWGCSDNLSLPAYVDVFEGLNEQSFRTFEDCRILVDNEYFQVYKIESIEAFINGLGSDLQPDLKKHFGKLYPPKILPKLTYSTNQNYTY